MRPSWTLQVCLVGQLEVIPARLVLDFPFVWDEQFIEPEIYFLSEALSSVAS
jgi:hypothetical protein